jgi:Uncharacterised nucleotidyltransferase
MHLQFSNPLELTSEASAVYREALHALTDGAVPFLVGGAYALAYHAGIVRHTKDFDIFVRPEDCRRTLDVLAGAGFRTEITFSHWLAKAFHGEYFIDVIFCSGNGLCRVDDAWFAHAAPAEILGFPLRLCPPEEMIWSKAFIQERERFDGADIAHLLRSCAARLDWDRLLRRFGPNWRVLFSHLILFGFIYPDERAAVPAWVTDQLWERFREEAANSSPSDRVCQGTLLSREQYLVDIRRWGYADAREVPRGSMNRDAIAHWTAAIDTGR